MVQLSWAELGSIAAALLAVGLAFGFFLGAGAVLRDMRPRLALTREALVALERSRRR
jgi:hypothetical protein